MKILEPVDTPRVERLSSIYQHKHMLAVRRGDEWVPITFDVLDGVECKHMRSHKALLTDKPYIGYSFPVGECSYSSQLYLTGDQKGTELKKLPSFFGSRFYEGSYDRKVLVNSANGALGVKNDTTLRVGLDYCLAKKTLDPVA